MRNPMARGPFPALLTFACAWTAAACADTRQPPPVGPDGGTLAGVIIAFTPERTVYAPGHLVRPNATVFNEYGEEVVGAAVEWTVTPASGASAQEDGLWFLGGEGRVTFQACSDIRIGTICGERDLLIDVSPPTLVITSPMPGAELLEEENPVIVVSGTISDANPEAVLGVSVNGQSVSIGSGGTFSTQLTPSFGINHIVVEGRDGFQAPVQKHMDVMWAPAYLPPDEGTTRFELADALQLRLGQRLFDTHLLGSDLNLDADPVVARDLASIVELVLWHADLGALLGGSGPVLDDANITLSITGFEVGDAIVDVGIIDMLASGVDGLDLHISLYDVFIGAEGEFRFSGETLQILGGLKADLFASARVTLGLNMDGTVQVAVTDVQASIGSLVGMFQNPPGRTDGDELNALLTVLDSTFRGLIEGVLDGEFLDTFASALPALFEGLLGALGDLLSDVVLELDTGLGDPVTLMIDGHIAALDIVQGPPSGSLVPPGHITVRLDATVDTTAEPVHPDSRGAAQPDAMPEPPFSNVAGLQLAIRQDFINALLHSLWNAGLLDGSVSLGSVAATVSAGLPPVVTAAPLNTTCRVNGVRCDVILQIGQLEVEAFGQRFGIHATAGAVVSVSNDAVSLAIQETPSVIVWDAGAPGLITTDLVRDLVISSVWPELFGAIGADLSIPLPLPNLTEIGLADIAPALADAALDLVARQRLNVASGYLGIGVDLELEAPQP
jgi:hypothetical protein